MVKGYTFTTENILQQEFKLKCKAVNMQGTSANMGQQS